MSGVYEPFLDWSWLLNGGLARGQTRPVKSLFSIIVEHGGPHRPDPYRWRVDMFDANDQWDRTIGSGWASTRFEAMEAAERFIMDSGVLSAHDCAKIARGRSAVLCV